MDGAENEARPGGELQQIAAPDGLDAIAREAARFDAEQGGAQDAPHDDAQAVRDAVSSAQEWRDAVQFGCGLVIAMRPELAEEWTGARLDSFGDALAKCGAHYGWNIEKLLGHPLFAVAITGFPLAMGLVRVEKARAEKKAADAAKPV